MTDVLRWGIILGEGACPHCGRLLAHHPGVCHLEPRGLHLDGAFAGARASQ